MLIHAAAILDPFQPESIIDQSEIGLGASSSHKALKNAMREAPDVILIGEIRDHERVQAALV